MKTKEGGVMDIQELIDFKYEEIEGLKLNLSEDHHMNPEQEDELEELIAQAIKFGELCAKRDAKAQAVPEGFVLVPKKATKKMLDAGYEAHDGFFSNGAVQDVYVAMIEAQEPANDRARD